MRERHSEDGDVVAVSDADRALIDALQRDARQSFTSLSVEPARVQAVAETLVELRQIDYAAITTGSLNVMAEAACSTTDDLYELVVSIRSLPGVIRTETFPYLRLLRQSFAWNRADGGGGSAVRAVPGTAVTPLDAGIIRALQRDGRASFRRLGAALGVSE